MGVCLGTVRGGGFWIGFDLFNSLGFCSHQGNEKEVDNGGQNLILRSIVLGNNSTAQGNPQCRQRLVLFLVTLGYRVRQLAAFSGRHGALFIKLLAQYIGSSLFKVKNRIL